VERADARSGVGDRVARAYREETSYVLRYLERVELGTSYPEVVDLVVETVEHMEHSGRRTLMVDLLRAAQLNARLVAVTDAASRVSEENWRVPERDLVTGLQVCLQTEELRIGSGLRPARVLGVARNTG
jgi:hypothetical protein